jgi:hypothetical protein
MTNRGVRVPRVAICVGLAGALLVVLAASVRADTLTTTDGKVYEGKVLGRTDAGVDFEVQSGGMKARLFIPADRISKIETGTTAAEQLLQDYEAHKKTLDLATGDGWYRLAQWCVARQMYDQAVQAFQESMAKDPALKRTSTLAQARMEVGRKRLRAARDLLAPLVTAFPDDEPLRTELAGIQAQIDAEVRTVFDQARLAYRRSDYATALPLFRRVVLEADAPLLADLARDLARQGEPGFAETLIACRLSPTLVDRPEAWQNLTPLEKPLLLDRLLALVEAGLATTRAAYETLAAMTGSQIGDRLPAARKELAALDRLETFARVAGTLAVDLKNDEAMNTLRPVDRAVADARANITLLFIETIQAGAKGAVDAMKDETASFAARLKAADGAAERIAEGLAALKRLAPQLPSLSVETTARVTATTRQFEDLDRLVRQQRDHLKRLDQNLQSGLSEYERRNWDLALNWFTRLLKEGTAQEGRLIEDLVRRRIGKDLVDLMIDCRFNRAQRDRRFEEVTAYERPAMDRELARRATDRQVRAAEQLRVARAAAAGSPERATAARAAIDAAAEATFYIDGRRQIGIPLTVAERARLADDIADMNRIIREARNLLAQP